MAAQIKTNQNQIFFKKWLEPSEVEEISQKLEGKDGVESKRKTAF